MDFRKREYTVTAAAFSEDLSYLVTGSASRKLMLWRVSDGRLLKEWRVQTRDVGRPVGAIVYAVGFTPNGQTVLSEASSGFGQRWSVLPLGDGKHRRSWLDNL